MDIKKFTTNVFQENCYLLWSADSKSAIIIDPGMMTERERIVVDDFIASKNLTLRAVLLTHAHIDHAASASYISEKYGCDVYANKLDFELAEKLPLQAAAFHLRIDVSPLTILKSIGDGSELVIGGENIKAIAVPGHSRGGMAYYFPEHKSVFVGDSIFSGSIGRTDLWGGNMDDLISSVKNNILSLPDDTMIYPGHGPITNVLEEKRYNTYLK